MSADQSTKLGAMNKWENPFMLSWEKSSKKATKFSNVKQSKENPTNKEHGDSVSCTMQTATIWYLNPNHVYLCPKCFNSVVQM